MQTLTVKITKNADHQLLDAYAAAHKRQHPDHRVIVGLNFFECLACLDHCHESGHGYLVRHNADYSLVEHITEVK